MMQTKKKMAKESLCVIQSYVYRVPSYVWKFKEKDFFFLIFSIESNDPLVTGNLISSTHKFHFFAFFSNVLSVCLKSDIVIFLIKHNFFFCAFNFVFHVKYYAFGRYYYVNGGKMVVIKIWRYKIFFFCFAFCQDMR
jgi:hypothetical protein